MVPSYAGLETPVRKSIRVRASAERAFRIYTEEIDSWWPRTHHIGNAPLERVILERRAGGRCYSKQTDGTECDWGTVLEWDPPRGFVMAWQVSPAWQYEPELAKASEVEVQFTPEEGGYTRVDLEHRHFERHGTGAESMRSKVDDPGGWSGLLRLFQVRAEQES
jgi:uncharacterized protein YndB with AHSA1/START domain